MVVLSRSDPLPSGKGEALSLSPFPSPSAGQTKASGEAWRSGGTIVGVVVAAGCLKVPPLPRFRSGGAVGVGAACGVDTVGGSDAAGGASCLPLPSVAPGSRAAPVGVECT